MNFLKEIKVRGEVFCEYAFLSYAFNFENNSAGVAAEYIFALPKGARLSNMRLIKDGKIINTSITSVTHAAKMQNDEEAYAVLRKLSDTEYVLSLGSVCGKLSVLLTVYAPIERECLIIPFSRGMGEGEGIERYADIELTVRGEGYKFISPTHNLEEDEGRIRTGKISADRDFCLEMSCAERKNTAVAVRDVFGGEMLCRLYLDGACENKKRRLIAIYDSSGILGIGESRAAREFICALAKAFEGEYMVISSGELLTNGFCKSSYENEEQLLCALSVTENGGDLKDDLRLAEEYSDSETAIVLVSGTNANPPAGVELVTVGAISAGYENIYERDNIEKRALEIASKISKCEISPDEVYAEGAEAVVAENFSDGVSVFLRYMGELPPTEITLKYGTECKAVHIDNTEIYRSFAPLSLAYADIVARRLEKEIEVCDICDIPEIRKKLEDTGIRYSALNSETAMFADLGEKRAGIRVIIPDRIGSGSAFDRPSMFRETDEDISKEFIKKCLKIVKRSIRADGAICADGEINLDIRKRQTLICLLALVSCGESAAAAEKYVSGYSFSGLEYSTKPEIAKAMLKTFFGDAVYVPCDIKPDLVTAARVIWQSAGKAF